MEQNGVAIRNDMTLEAYSRDMDNKIRMGAMILKSGLCPAAFKTPEAVVAAIWYGQEIGFTPMQSLQVINVIQGKPSVSAAGLQAKAIEAGGDIKELEHTEMICRLQITRGKSIRLFSFSISEAEVMGLLVKDNWKRMPKAMLYARAVTQGVRAMFADKILGLNSTEELEDAIFVEAQEKKGTRKKEDVVVEAEVVSATEPEVQAPTEERPLLFSYDLGKLQQLHPDKVGPAVRLLQKHGATTDDELGLYWRSPEKVEKLNSFEVP